MTVVYFGNESLEIDLEIFDSVQALIHFKDGKTIIEDEQFFRELQYCNENLFNLRVSFEQGNIFHMYGSNMLYPQEYTEIYMRETMTEKFLNYDNLIKIKSLPNQSNKYVKFKETKMKKSCNTENLDRISKFLHSYLNSFVVTGNGVLNSFIELDRFTYDIYFYEDRIKEMIDFISSKTPLYFTGKYYFFESGSVKIRIFPIIFSSPSEIAHSISVDCESIIYIPHKFEIYCTERCFFSLKYRMNCLKFEHYSDEVSKYKQFECLVPYENSHVTIRELYNRINNFGKKNKGIYGLMRKFYGNYDENNYSCRQYPYNVEFQILNKPEKQIIENPLEWIKPYEIKVFEMDDSISKELKVFSHEEFGQIVNCKDEIVYENIYIPMIMRKNTYISEFLMEMVMQHGCILTNLSAIQAFTDFDISSNTQIQIFSDETEEIVNLRYKEFLFRKYEISMTQQEIKNHYRDMNKILRNIYPLVLNSDDQDLIDYYNLMYRKMQNLKIIRKIYNFKVSPISIDGNFKSKKENEIYGNGDGVSFPNFTLFGNILLTNEGVIASEFTLYIIKNKIIKFSGDGTIGFGIFETPRRTQELENFEISVTSSNNIQSLLENIDSFDIDDFQDMKNQFSTYIIIKKLIEDGNLNLEEQTINGEEISMKTFDAISSTISYYETEKDKPVHLGVYFEDFEISMKISTQDRIRNIIRKMEGYEELISPVKKYECESNVSRNILNIYPDNFRNQLVKNQKNQKNQRSQNKKKQIFFENDDN